MLPPATLCEHLITHYFIRLSPFFHILHGPTFQIQYKRFQKGQSTIQLSWLALLFSVCSITINTMEDNDPVLSDLLSGRFQAPDVAALSRQYRAAALICLSQDNFMVHHRLSTLEALLILIYTVTHTEGPAGSWVLLGTYRFDWIIRPLINE